MFILLILVLITVVLNIIFSLSLIFIERRDPPTTWAWLFIMILMPGLGFIIYLLLGQNLSRQKLFKEKTKIDEIRRIKPNSKFYSINHSHDGGFKYIDLRRMNYRNNGSLYTINNNVRLFYDGKRKFKQLISDIKNAKKFIHVEYYIFRRDNLGLEIIDELTKKAREGLEVRILVDSMGSYKLTRKSLKEYLNAGGKFSIFFPGIFPHINTRINYRNHRKIVVIDGKYGYVGGFNIGDEYIGKDPKIGFWRDTHVRIQGEAVSDLSERFLLDWCYASGEKIDKYENYFNKDIDIVGDTGIQIVTSGPDHNEEYIRNSYLKIINNAKKNLYLETPYLVPDITMLETLKISALSGVDVRIIIPGNPDHFFMKWAASSYIGDLLNAGVRIYSYENGFIHAKTIVSDSIISSVGTANLDIRSFKLNFEVNAVIYDDRVSINMEDQFFKDIENSTEITIDIYNKRSRLLRIQESLVRLLSPIL
ncbi:cardiolipin synthase [Clostridium sp. BJN0001]|uniref:cardiolipin synthase n=1 Tax=Clostridium sp. BJN0001 TaxID=2930219 RepID=UPI001FD3295F|nr:cardiolipin synthase [Clostridium sp. BJN0001]